MLYKTIINNSLIFIFLLLVSCNSSKKEELEANEQIKIIENLIEKNALNDAKIKIDSFHILFRKLVDKRRIASALEDTIIRRECARNLLYCDSIYPLKKQEFDSIAQYFRFEKDTVYQKYGNYVNKNQITEQNSNRNYLKCIIDENAGLQLISNYTGTKIAHNWIEVKSGEIYAAPDSTNKSGISEHYYNDGSYYFERVTFENKAALNIVKFIYNNKLSGITVTLKGKKNYSYKLNSNDAKAIADAYHLWILKTDLIKLEKEILKSKTKIQKINLRK